jgi:hypothetical protein
MFFITFFHPIKLSNQIFEDCVWQQRDFVKVHSRNRAGWSIKFCQNNLSVNKNIRLSRSSMIIKTGFSLEMLGHNLIKLVSCFIILKLFDIGKNLLYFYLTFLTAASLLLPTNH